MSDRAPEAWDVVVVGAGPAGAATALRAARAGLRTLLVERSSWPRHKVCGCCLHPAAVGELTRLDRSLAPAALGARPLDRARIRARGRAASLPIAGAAAIGRARLDGRLAELAQEAGVELRTETRARLLPDAGASGHRVLELVTERGARAERARVVVAADGLGAPLLSRVGDVSSPSAPRARLGLGARVPDAAGAVGESEVELVVGNAGYVGLVGLEDGSLDVAAAVDPEYLAQRGPARAIAGVLEEARREPIEGLERVAWRGTPTLSRTTPIPAARRALAVGDAAGYVEPFTGEGIAWALAAARRAGEALPELVADWAPARARTWARGVEAELARRRRRCRAVARCVRSPRLLAALALPLARSEFLATLVARVGYGPARP